jgi:phosphatidylinositol-3-phosphatase
MWAGGAAVKRLWLIVPVLVLLGCASAIGHTSATAHRDVKVPKARLAAGSTPPQIRHVFTIILENESASTTFGPNPPAPYLAKTLTSEGAYLPKYYGVGHDSNDNYIAMISGQPPNVSNETDCGTFSNFATTSRSSYGAQDGDGCVYPADIDTIAGQLAAKGLSWRDFNQSMGNTPSREAAECGHPAVGSTDNTESETAQDAYATRHDPFVYFHSIIDNTTRCDDDVVNLNDLPADLATAAKTPNYVFITPDLCADGHDATCSDSSRPGGFAGIEQFLQQWVPQITNSPAFKQQNGLLIVTFDEASTSDSGNCCGEIPGPAGVSLASAISGDGGGDVGAVLLSPCIKPGTVSQTPYNHYTMLRSIEDIFGLSHIGYAQLPGEVSFGSDVFTQPCAFPTKPTVSAKAKGTKITVKWSTSDAGGPGVAHYTVQVQQAKGGWKTIHGLSSTTKRSTVYKGKAHAKYAFRVEFVDKLGKTSPFGTSKRVSG